MAKIAVLLFALIAPYAFAASTDNSDVFPPAMKASIPNQTVTIGTVVTWNAAFYIRCATTPGSTVNSPAWSMANGVPGLTINATSGLVTGTPTNPFTGTTTITCINGKGSVTSNAFQYTVNANPNAVVATGYFVNCNGTGTDAGSDSNSGTSPATPWRTLARAVGNATCGGVSCGPGISTVGSDLWVKTGSDCQEALVWTLSGTAANHVVIGSYYVFGSTAYQLTPTNPTAWPTDYVYSQPRAQVSGSCPATKWDDVACKRIICPTSSSSYAVCHAAYPNDVAPGVAIPLNLNYGLIQIAANYVDIQDIKVYGPAGFGVLVDAATPVQHDIMIRRMYFEDTLMAFVRLYIAQNITIRDNVSIYAATYGNPDTTRPNTAGLSLTNAGTSNRNQYLVEGNDMSKSSTGVQISFGTKSLIFRGNRIGDIQAARPCFYGDDGDDIVFEYNICYSGDSGGNTDPTLRTRGVAMASENNASFFAHHVALTDFLVRGNMFTNVGACWEMSDAVQNDALTGDRSKSGKFYNNTCIFANADVIDLGGVYHTSGAIEVKNNIFQTTGTPACSADTNGPGVAPVFDYNMWNVLPPVECRGTHDILGTAVVAGTNMGTKNSTTNKVVPADFVLQPGSPGLNAGTPLSLTILATSDYPEYTGITYPCATFDLKGSVIDAQCVARNPNNPTLGAIGP